MTDGRLKPEVRQQYLQDLRERWMFDPDPIERHKKSRMFLGRLVELQFAEWLELKGWSISGLEAIREGPDIEAYTSGGQATAFEVKFISTENDDFALILDSIAGRPAAGSASPYDAADYLLFRVYEAAKQLQRTDIDRIAVVVVEDLTWDSFEVQIEERWIDWNSPKFFFRNAFGKFLEGQRARYPDLPDDLQPTLRSLNAVWILRQLEGYQYHQEFEELLNRACGDPAAPDAC
jgi:hypothetical protein